MKHLCAVRDEALDVSEAMAAVSHPEAGGIAVFVGVVRNHNDGRPVTLLEYEAYGSMAEKQMLAIVKEIEAEIPGARLSALHRIGKLSVGDTAVVCVAATPHRGDAFRACQALIDRIKERVPVWKREHGPDGPYWVGWEDARCGHGHEAGPGHGSTGS